MGSEEFLECTFITSPWQPMNTTVPESYDVEFVGWMTTQPVNIAQLTNTQAVVTQKHVIYK
jgi:hypothetical protein